MKKLILLILLMAITTNCYAYWSPCNNTTVINNKYVTKNYTKNVENNEYITNNMVGEPDYAFEGRLEVNILPPALRVHGVKELNVGHEANLLDIKDEGSHTSYVQIKLDIWDIFKKEV